MEYPRHPNMSDEEYEALKKRMEAYDVKREEVIRREQHREKIIQHCLMVITTISLIGCVITNIIGIILAI